MLNHIGEIDAAEKIQNAWLKTIESGIHTKDLYRPETSAKLVGTAEFADAVIANLGQMPTKLAPVNYDKNVAINLPKYKRAAPKKKVLVGVDLFVDWKGLSPDELAEMLKKIQMKDTQLTMITNRGIKVWPEGFQETFCTDHWRCRFKSEGDNTFSYAAILELMQNAL